MAEIFQERKERIEKQTALNTGTFIKQQY